MTMAIITNSALVASIKHAASLLSMVLLLSACTSGIEQDAASSPMKFSVPGGDRFLRAVDASSIKATFTLSLDGQGTTPALLMSRVAGSNQWQTPRLNIPANTGFVFRLSWFAVGIDGVSVEYAFQSFRSDSGVNANQNFDVSALPYNFDNFDSDGDGVNNYEELMAGTSPTIFDESTTDTGSAEVGSIDAGTADTGTADTGLDGGAIVPSGGTVGVWFGSNNFGEGVMIVDANENIFGLAANGSGQYETVFGPAAGTLERFIHRDSGNPAFADSFTLGGDIQLDATGDGNPLAYNLTAQNDGQQIGHTGADSDFSMTFATENDLSPISLASIAGDWISKTSFCPTDCNVTLEMTITEAGDVSGSTQFNDSPVVLLAGTASIAEASTQYLSIQFTWADSARLGVIHVDRRDPTRLIINTVGPDSTGTSASFTASMIRR